MSTTGVILLVAIVGVFALAVFALFAKSFLGLVVVNEREVGVVIRKFGRALPPGKLIATNNEAGFQADTLPPAGTSAISPGNTPCAKRR